MSFFTGVTTSGKATAAIVANRFVISATTAEGSPRYTAASDQSRPVGIAMEAASAAEDVVPVAINGVGLLYVNANTTNIVAGDPITCGAAGVGVKATADDHVAAVALDPASADGVSIRVVLTPNGKLPEVGTALTDATNSITLTAAQLTTGKLVQLTASYAGAVALAIPGAASVPRGHRLYLLKTGSAGAVTVTPAAGSIGDAATHATVDATSDYAIYESDGIGNWAIYSSNIA